MRSRMTLSCGVSSSRRRWAAKGGGGSPQCSVGKGRCFAVFCLCAPECLRKLVGPLLLPALRAELQRREVATLRTHGWLIDIICRMTELIRGAGTRETGFERRAMTWRCQPAGWTILLYMEC